MKLLIDEMYPARLAEELRKRRHDVVSVHESPGRGTSDQEIFEFARGEGRAVVTENVSDFRPVAEAALADENHARVVFATEKRWLRSDPGRLISELDELLKITDDQPLNAEIWL